ncbi:MAG: recombinase family protein [Planctomycetaceae bacterium]|nr:recombinase family protein [Planctomycetaceae bacterium]
MTKPQRGGRSASIGPTTATPSHRRAGRRQSPDCDLFGQKNVGQKYGERCGVNEGISLEAQKARIVAWCELNECQLAGVYVDAGISGKRADNRPELQKAIEAVVRCRGVLLVYSLSRLARSTKDTLSIS